MTKLGQIGGEDISKNLNCNYYVVNRCNRKKTDNKDCIAIIGYAIILNVISAGNDE